MARILVFSNPKTHDFKEYNPRKGLTLKEFLLENSLDNQDFCLEINGQTPDKADLDYKIKEDDLIKLTSGFMGNDPENDSNKTLSTVLQIATVIAVIALTIASAGTSTILLVSLGGNLLAGGVRILGQKSIDPASPSIPDLSGTSAPIFSLASAQNESRPLQKMPMILGSHRYAPDFFSQPYQKYIGGITEEITATIQTYRPMDEDKNNWTIVEPTDFQGGGNPAIKIWGYWPYNIKVNPGIFNVSPTASDTMFSQPPGMFGANNFGSPDLWVVYNLVYHYEPADPLFGKYSTWGLIKSAATDPVTFEKYSDLNIARQNYLYLFDKHTEGDGFYTPNKLNLPTNTTQLEAIKAFLDAPINTYWTAGSKYLTPSAPGLASYPFFDDSSESNKIESIRRFVNSTLNASGNQPEVFGNIYDQKVKKITESPVTGVSHVFNYGLGDLNISEEKVDKVDFQSILGIEKSFIDKSTSSLPATANSDFLTNVAIRSGSELVNDSNFSGPANPISVFDDNIYNFVYRESPQNTRSCEIDVEGNLYGSGTSGLVQNENSLDLHFRIKGEASWQTLDGTNFDNLYWVNDNTQLQKKTYQINFPSANVWEVRIRKRSLDSANNNGNDVARFRVTNFKFFLQGQDHSMKALNTAGLFLTTSSQTSGQTNKYSALVQNKVYVYENGNWIWKESRNPAWQFLYFAKGGWLNPGNDISSSYPDSPTYGWTNSSENPSSTEKIFGAGLALDEIDVDKIKEWAIFCEERDLKCDLVIRDNISSQEVLARIADTGRAGLTYYEGLLSVIYESELQEPVAIFGMGNIIKDSFSVSYVNRNLPSKLIGRFVDRDDDWNPATVEVLIPDSDADEINFVEVDLIGITERDRAQREINILAARQAFTRTKYTWKTSQEGLVFKRGDLVYLSHDLAQNDFSGRLLNIEAEEITLDQDVHDLSSVYLRNLDGEIIQIDGVQSGPNKFKPNAHLNVLDFPEDSRDVVYIAGSKATTGLIVRIDQVVPEEKNNYTITAIKEEKSIYAFEFDQTSRPDESSEVIVSTLENFNYNYNSETSTLSINFEKKNAYAVYFEKDGNALIGKNGSYTFFNSAEFQLSAGSNTITAIPFAVGVPYESKKIIFSVDA